MITIEQVAALRLDSSRRYKIKIMGNESVIKKKEIAMYVRAKLIQQTDWLFIFQHRDKHGNAIRTTIRKIDYLINKKLIEVC